MPTMSSRHHWLCLYCVGHLPRSALTVYLLWHFSTTPSDPLQAPLYACGMSTDFSSVQHVEDPISNPLVSPQIFCSIFFFTNKHALVSAHTYTHSVSLAYMRTHRTGIKANSVLGLLLLPWSCPLPLPLCLTPILEREDLL